MIRVVFLLAITLFSRENIAISYPNVSENIKISSNYMEYDINYRVFLPEAHQQKKNMPVIYFTDGPMYLYSGRVAETIQKLITEKEIKPIVAVFVDARDPDNLENNRRNYEFFCNPKYAEFFTKELVPQIDSQYLTSNQAADRVIMGLSFGGLNSACFGLLASSVFEGIGMLSPAMHPVEKMFEYYEKSERLPLNFFISTGTIDDNESKTRKFKQILQDKGYPVKYKQVRKGRHDWDNWKPLTDDYLKYFFSLPTE